MRTPTPIDAQSDTPMRHRRARSTRWLAVPIASALVLAAACGSSSDSSDDGGTSSETGEETASEFIENMPECPVDALADATGPVEITLWQSFNAKPKEGFEQLVAEFNASQDQVVVKNESQGASYQEIWDKYLEAAGADDLPNLAVLEDVNARAVSESGTVLPAQACIDADGTDTSTWMKSAMSYYSIDGAFVPGTSSLSSPILYFNKGHFRSAGLDPESPPKTLTELREYAQKLKDAGVTDKPLVLYLHPWIIDTWLSGAGAQVVNNDNGHGPGITDQSTFESPESLEVYTWIQDMNDAGLVTAIPYDGKTIDHYLAMQNQSASMLIETSTASVSIKAVLVGDTITDGSGNEVAANPSAIDVGAGPIPGLTQPGKAMMGGNVTVMTLSGTPEQQAASWAFIKWWNQPDTQAKWNRLSSYIPFNQAALDEPSLKEYWAADMIGPWLQISFDQLSGISVDNTGPTMGPYDKYRDAVTNTAASLVTTNTPPADAAAKVVTDTNKALADYNEGGF